MQAVIQKVVATETEAKQLVQAARTETGERLASARWQARQIVEAAKREARLEAAKTLAAAETEATNEKNERLARAAREMETNLRLDEATTRQAVEAALRCVRGGSEPTAKAP